MRTISDIVCLEFSDLPNFDFFGILSVEWALFNTSCNPASLSKTSGTPITPMFDLSVVSLNSWIFSWFWLLLLILYSQMKYLPLLKFFLPHSLCWWGFLCCFLICSIVFFSSSISKWFCFTACISFVTYSLNPCLCFSLSLKDLPFFNAPSKRTSMFPSCNSKTEMVFCLLFRKTQFFALNCTAYGSSVPLAYCLSDLQVFSSSRFCL